MKLGLSIFEIFEELAFKKPGVTQIGHIIYDDLGNINNIKYYNIGELSLKPILEEKQPGVKQIDREKDTVVLKVIVEVIKPKRSSHEIELSLPDLRRMTREQRIIVDEFFTEAEQLIKEIQARDEITPFAPTVYLEKMHTKIIGFGVEGCRAVEELEKIFSFKD